jgi:hypothetical protein
MACQFRWFATLRVLPGFKAQLDSAFEYVSLPQYRPEETSKNAENPPGLGKPATDADKKTEEEE